MTAQEFGRGDPSVMVFNRSGATRIIRVSQLPLTITHNQQTLDAQIITAVFEFLQVWLVFSFVLEELVDVLHGLDSKVLFGVLGESHVVELAAINRAVQ